MGLKRGKLTFTKTGRTGHVLCLESFRHWGPIERSSGKLRCPALYDRLKITHEGKVGEGTGLQRSRYSSWRLPSLSPEKRNSKTIRMGCLQDRCILMHIPPSMELGWLWAQWLSGGHHQPKDNFTAMFSFVVAFYRVWPCISVSYLRCCGFSQASAAANMWGLDLVNSNPYVRANVFAVAVTVYNRPSAEGVGVACIGNKVIVWKNKLVS